MRTWLLMTYRVPRHPTASRVYVWRKLKKLGALRLQDAAWALPLTAQTREQVQWLAAEITEMHGEAMVWQATTLTDGQDAALANHFEKLVEAPYHSILAALKKKNPNLATLSRQYQDALAQDHTASALGRQTRAALLKAKGGNAE